MKTAEELGLYNDLPPDATVDGMVEDPANPGWVEAHFSDGRVATLPREHAEGLPQTQATAPAPVYDPANPAGPPAPVVPPQGPMTPEELAGTGQPGGGATPFLGAGAPGGFGALGSMVGGAQASADGQLVNAPTDTVGAESTIASYQDPNTALVSEGSGPGFAPYSESTSQSSTTSETVDDPAVMQGRVADAQLGAAQAARAGDMAAYHAKAEGLDTEYDAREAQEAQLRVQQRAAELEVAEHQRVIQAIEKTPIDEDGFWNESPGRAAAAWVGLALSGFLQGVTRGQNNALNQMVQSLNHAQDRWLDNQQKQRNSVLANRTKLMGSAENARDSLKSQLSGVLNRKIQVEAGRAGLPVPPGLETYVAKDGMKAAEAFNAIGSRIRDQATIQAQSEQRAMKGTAPKRQADVVLQNLLGPEYQKKHADAMDPKKLNLGGVVAGSSRLQDISDALSKIAAANGGDLQAKTVGSWESLGLAPMAARLGIKNAQTQVNTKQLLEEAKLAFKQTVNIKSIDSENEGKNFNAIMDSGESGTTLAAIRQKAGESSQTAVSIADGVAPGAAQQYLDYVRSTQDNNRGARPTPGDQKADAASRVTFKPLAGGSPEERAVEQTAAPAPAPSGAGGPATPPLPATASGQAGTYLRGRFRKPN